VTAHFELSGEFAGFIRTIQGKRRMLLRTGGGDMQLKIPSSLRHRLDGRLSAGCAVTVSGLEHREHGGSVTRAVLRVEVSGPVAADACFACPIQVCTKKNCWKQGGRELWRALEQELAGIDGAPALESVHCLDRCKHAPNFDCGALEFERCAPERARRFVHELAALSHAPRES
jgi:hypothetical protein